MDKKTVVVGMSGGVDSSVAALILKESGYNVIGLFMHNWDEEDGGVCTSATDWQDVIGVCGKLDIPYYSVKFAKEYRERVFEYFLREYKAGRTPNPDVLCNREIKFDCFAKYALKLEADYIATGHYCDLVHKSGKVYLAKAIDQNKDQTYFLNQVSSEQLANVMFPLGKLTKPEVRKIAEDNSLVTAKKKDSTGICFIGERNFRKFLSQYLPSMAGEIVTTDGKVIGEHMGLMYYTLGQRRGLGIGGVKEMEQSRWYVVDKQLDKNRLIVSCGEGEELFVNRIFTEKMSYITDKKTGSFPAKAKFRYRQPDQQVFVISQSDGSVVIESEELQRAVTPGQFATLYESDSDGNEICLGGAIISGAEMIMSK